MNTKELWGKRKYLSAWRVWLISAALHFGLGFILLIFNKIDFKSFIEIVKIFKDITWLIWGFYFASNAASKFANNKEKKK